MNDMTDTNTSGEDVLARLDSVHAKLLEYTTEGGHPSSHEAEDYHDARTAVAALIEREAALETDLARVSEELGLPPKIGPAPGVIRALIAERDALAAEVKALREDACRWHEIAARYDAASGLQCANVLAAFGYPHDQPWFPLGHFVDAARASAATGGGNG